MIEATSARVIGTGQVLSAMASRAFVPSLSMPRLLSQEPSLLGSQQPKQPIPENLYPKPVNRSSGASPVSTFSVSLWLV